VDDGARDEEGFTLIELMVVVLIIAVLIAIAIPTFLGARQAANDRATQSNVRNAFTATRVYYNDGSTYSETPSEMQGVEPSLAWTNTALDATSPDRSIYLKTFDGNQTVVVVGRTATGRCFYLKDVMGGSGSGSAGTYYDRSAPSGGTCPIPDPASPAWTTKWSTN
jgi:type IV pilus assembly protein PilA